MFTHTVHSVDTTDTLQAVAFLTNSKMSYFAPEIASITIHRATTTDKPVTPDFRSKFLLQSLTSVLSILNTV